MKNGGMSEDMYNFISDNLNKLEYDLAKGKVITPRGTNGSVCNSTGYLRVKVSGRTLQVHQILGVIYFGRECIGKQINHKDGNKLNNKRKNLEPITRAENIKHAYENGLSYKVNGNAMLTDEQVKEIRKRYIPNYRGKNGARDLGKEFGMSRINIVRIANRELYKKVN